LTNRDSNDHVDFAKFCNFNISMPVEGVIILFMHIRVVHREDGTSAVRTYNLNDLIQVPEMHDIELQVPRGQFDVEIYNGTGSYKTTITHLTDNTQGIFLINYKDIKKLKQALITVTRYSLLAEGDIYLRFIKAEE
jgi:hypothetical protein